MVRFASEPGTLEPDTVQRARGVALKVLSVPGEVLREGWTSQDLLFNSWPVIPQGDAASFLDLIRTRDTGPGALAGPPPRPLTDEDALFDRTPNVHVLGVSHDSQGAFRYGEHVAVLALVPVGDAQLALATRAVPGDAAPGVLRDWVAEHFAAGGASYELRV